MKYLRMTGMTTMMTMMKIGSSPVYISLNFDNLRSSIFLFISLTLLGL